MNTVVTGSSAINTYITCGHVINHMITQNTSDMGKYCLKPHPVYFNAFPMWQQVLGPVQDKIISHITCVLSNYVGLSCPPKL